MLHSIKSKKGEVVSFLKELHELLEKDGFDKDIDIIVIRKKKQGNEQKYSTPYTLLDLDYDIDDVIRCLKELSINEYSETKLDKDDLNPPLLFVFGKYINNKCIYIKLKGSTKKYIVCVSFHYAKNKMIFPYT